MSDILYWGLVAYGVIVVWGIISGAIESRRRRKEMRKEYTALYESGEIYKERRKLKKSVFWLEYHGLNDLAEKILAGAPEDVQMEIMRDRAIRRALGARDDSCGYPMGE